MEGIQFGKDAEPLECCGHLLGEKPGNGPVAILGGGVEPSPGLSRLAIRTLGAGKNIAAAAELEAPR